MGLFRAALVAYGGSQARVEWELQLLVYATAMPDLICVCELHNSSWQHCILNPLSKARDQTRIPMVSSWVR